MAAAWLARRRPRRHRRRPIRARPSPSSRRRRPAASPTSSAAALAQRFTKAWGQQAVVENKPGANNQLAAEYIVNSPPDGHTLFIAPDGTFVANPSLYPKLPYDPYKSFTPISGLMIINHGLIEHPSFPPNNVTELIALAKQKPGDDQLRHLRHRLERPSQHGAAGDHGRREAPGHPLQGRGAGDERRARRPHPDGVRQRRLRRAADGRAASSR